MLLLPEAWDAFLVDGHMATRYNLSSADQLKVRLHPGTPPVPLN